MGRVSKHKKIKSCDPFYKGPRTNPARKGDLPPDNDEDQPPPKSFLRFLRYNKQFEDKIRRPVHSKTTPTPSQAMPTKRTKSRGKGGGIPVKSAEGSVSVSATVSATLPSRISDASRGPPGESGVLPLPQGRAAMFVRQPGESMRSYLERIDIESKNRLVDCFRKEKKKSGKRKQYLEERRKKLKSRKRKKEEPDFHQFKDEVKFGEVVQAPPRLSAKPRGSEKKSKNTPKHEPMKACSLLEPTTDKVSMGGLKRQRDIEEEREKVISKYREVKKAQLKDRRTTS